MKPELELPTQLVTECERLERLAKIHDMQKPESLDMDQYFHDVPVLAGMRGCGTPSCSLGWALTLMPDLNAMAIAAETAYLDRDRFYGDYMPDAITTAMKYFGVEKDYQEKLFGNYPRTPTEQAEVLRDYSQKKKDDWINDEV